MEKNTSEKKGQPEIPAKKPGIRAGLFKPTGIAAITIAAAIGICIIIALFVSEKAVPADLRQDDLPVQLTTETEQELIPTEEPALYEEPTEGNLDDLVKQVDLTLINTLKKAQISMRDLKLEDVSLKKYQGRGFHFQQLRFPYKGDRTFFIEQVKSGLESTALNASIHEIAADCWLISINGIPTHKFFIFTPQQKEKPAPLKTDPNAPKIAIVIDDLGEDIKFAKGLAALDAHITFSIWPNSSHVQKTLEIARKRGNEIMIHLPMQPKGYPKVNPGADALLVDMSAADIRQTVLAAIKKVPGAVGLNNHMGSLFTENYAGMSVVMSQLHRKKLFFLDSRTTPDSAGRKAAARAGVPMYERNIFLDNVKDVSAIKFQLSKAVKIARKQGQAIAIGHPNRETLKAIKQWSQENRGKVNIVPVKTLIYHK